MQNHAGTLLFVRSLYIRVSRDEASVFDELEG